MDVLVLCTGNACRSQITEGFLRELGADRVTVRSAGISPTGLDSRTTLVMAEIGIDISGHISDHVSRYLGDRFDYVITVCDNAEKNCPIFPGETKKLHWTFDDPAAATGTDEQVLVEFRQIRDEIKAKVETWLGLVV